MFKQLLILISFYDTNNVVLGFAIQVSFHIMMFKMYEIFRFPLIKCGDEKVSRSGQ